jgi:DtxR family Mn-dependent transcriptional regulator
MEVAQRPSQTVEDYLLLIYTMRREHEVAIPARIKERLHVTAPTALATLRRMERDGLVSLKRGQEVELTQDGLEAAESTMRRHMLAERLLVDVLKLAWEDAHEEAHRMEHAISPRVEAQLLEMLNHPTTCPHGNPIPGMQKGPLPETKPLSSASDGEKLVIQHLRARWEDYDLMRYLHRNSRSQYHTLVEEVALPCDDAVSLTAQGRWCRIARRR